MFLFTTPYLPHDCIYSPSYFCRCLYFVSALRFLCAETHSVRPRFYTPPFSYPSIIQTPFHLFFTRLVLSSTPSYSSVSFRFFSHVFSHCLSLPLSVSRLFSSPHKHSHHPRDWACLLCLFHISALCSCDGNLSFKYLFLPSSLLLSSAPAPFFFRHRRNSALFPSLKS